MPRQDISSERKEQILDTAAAVFARRGFHQARMDDIVQESGLSKGAIYWYFKSKDEIILALMQRFFDRELSGLQALLTAEGAVRDRLLQFTQAVVQDVAQIAELGLMPLFLDFYGLSSRNAEVRAFLQATYTRSYRDALIPLIRQGIDRGEFRPVDPIETVITLTALYEGLIVLWTIDPQTVRLEAQFTAAMELLLAGLAAEA